MTDRGLRRLVDVWKRRLPVVSTYDISARFATAKELRALGADYGHCEWDDRLMTATILILDGDRPREAVTKDLIHEMLHPTIGRGRERAVNLIATAFWEAYRRRRKS